MQAGTVVAQNVSLADRVLALAPESRAIRLASFSVADQSEPYVVLDRRARRALTPLLGRSPVATVLYRESTIGGAYLGRGAGRGRARGRVARWCRSGATGAFRMSLGSGWSWSDVATSARRRCSAMPSLRRRAHAQKPR